MDALTCQNLQISSRLSLPLTHRAHPSPRVALASHCCCSVHTLTMREREREIYFKSHISLWEHSSHFRLIGRGVPSVPVVSQLVYKVLCLASPKENPQVPI